MFGKLKKVLREGVEKDPDTALMSEEAKELTFELIENNPLLFARMAAEAAARIKLGADRTKVGTELFVKYQRRIMNSFCPASRATLIQMGEDYAKGR